MDRNTVTVNGEALCAHCDKPIYKNGDMWVHPDPNGGWYRDCYSPAGQMTDTQAMPAIEPALQVAQVSHVGGSQSWHVIDSRGAEHVVWLNHITRYWSGWKTTAEATDDGQPRVISVAYKHITDLDPRGLIGELPVEVAEAVVYALKVAGHLH